MTTVVEVLKRAAHQCSLPIPNTWAAATRLEHVEFRDFLAETVEEILDRVDLPSPVGKQTTITGDGSESYSLPSDFRRLARDPLAVYETTTLRRAGVPVSSDGAWTHLNQIGAAGTNRFYAVEGYDANWTIKFERDLTSGNSVTVSYVSNIWCKSSADVEQDEFTSDDDVLLIPRLPVEAGIVWRFRARKGFPYSDMMARYEAHLSRLVSDSRGIRKICFGGAPDDAKVMRVPVPDYIPES